ncbi:DNA polymerase III alpha subunit [Geomicrobium sp. JCM 19037]|nr:DNA polymerase III alpha subunit [Geomicrobium sp. JCM 19037]
MAHRIVDERMINGSYYTFVDFCRRVKSIGLNRKTIANLVKAGAMDAFEWNRSTLLQSIDRALEFVDFAEDIGTLFHSGEGDFRFADAVPFTKLEELEYEREMTGFYLSGHPLSHYAHVASVRHPKTILQVLALEVANSAWVAGRADVVTTIRTKNGQTMAFLQLSDETGEMEIVIFPEVYRHVYDAFMKGNIYSSKVKLNKGANKSRFLLVKCSI